MEDSKETTKKRARNFMTRNVTEFRHLIKNCFITQNDLNWVINLRDNDLKQIEKKSQLPPQVFFKATKSSEFKIRKKDDKSRPNVRANEYDHFFLKGDDHVNQTQNQINFYSSLRKENYENAPFRVQSEKEFVNLPFKERRSVKFLKKDCIKKIKNITEDDFQSGLDGAHKQAKYTEKIVRVKNYACLSAFTKLRGRKQVSLPSLAWQMGLRDY